MRQWVREDVEYQREAHRLTLENEIIYSNANYDAVSWEQQSFFDASSSQLKNFILK